MRASEKADPKERDVATETMASFLLGGAEFALPVKGVQEVVNPPARLVKVPLAPQYLLGVFNLRGTIIPVVDLRTILRLSSGPQASEDAKIAIVEHQGIRIGLLFDLTHEIFRCRPDERSDFSYGSSSQRSVNSGAIKLDAGRRIIQILDVDALIKLEAIPQVAASEAEARRRRHGQHVGARKQCISFVVAGGKFAFGIEAINEIIKMTALNTSMIISDECMGTFDLRGDVVPVLDFAKILGMHSASEAAVVPDEQRIVIMKAGKERFGLLVDDVDSIVSYFSEDLLTLPAIEHATPALFLGCLTKTEDVDIILLNHAEILSSRAVQELTSGHGRIYESSGARGTEERQRKGRRKSYITFRIDDLLAVGIEEVREIIDYPRSVLHPPGLPRSVKGMVNLRGKMVLILDPRTIYEAERQSGTEAAKVIIFERSGVSYGMVVDSVESIVSFSEEDTIKLPEILFRDATRGGINQDIKFAVEIETPEGKKTLMILNLDPLASRAGLSPAVSTPTAIESSAS